MEFYENRSKRPFIAFVWVAKTLRNWYRMLIVQVLLELILIMKHHHVAGFGFT